MSLSWEQVVIDAHDHRALGRWWAQGLGWVVTFEDDTEVEVRQSQESAPALLFLPVSDERVVKNRLHLDFRPDDQAREVERLIGMGATRIDIGQGEATWVVLADPEGNEFCVLRSATGD